MFDWFFLSMCMQVILDFPFARQGSAPIGGGKKRKVQGLDYRNPCNSFLVVNMASGMDRGR